MLATAKQSQRSWAHRDPSSSQKQNDTPSRQRPKKISIDARSDILLQNEMPETSKLKTAI